MSWLIQVLGGVIVLYASLDVFLTILYARSGKGILAPYLNRALWGLFRMAARRFAAKRDVILSYSGSVILVVLSATWALLLVTGFALVYWPVLGGGVQASQGSTPTAFSAALYYSAYSLTTLGTGDLVPQSPLYRLLMVAEAAIGFSFFTLIITYILSIYEALRRRNAFTLIIHHKTDTTGDAKIFVTAMAAGGRPAEATEQLSKIADYVSMTIEMHRFYPILQYFRFKKSCYAIPRAVMIALDTASLMKTAFDPEANRAVTKSVPLAELRAASTHLVHALAEGIPVRQERLSRQAPKEQEKEWEEHYRELLDSLSREGTKTAPDAAAGAAEYVARRRQWQPYIEALAEAMLYEESEPPRRDEP
jgi:hypothetical protein